MVIDVIKLGIPWALSGVFFMAPVSVLGEETCTIRSIRISSAPERRIAPGEPIALAFEVDAECVGLEGDGPRGHRQEPRLCAMVGRDLSQHVELDDTVFRNRLSEGMNNDIILFEPKPLVPGTVPRAGAAGATIRRIFSFVGTIFIVNTKESRRFVFDASGVHTLVFGKVGGARATISVIVDVPTPQEQEISKKLRAGDLLLTLASVDDCSKYSAEHLGSLNQALEQAKGTRYEKYLSVAVGIGSMCELQRNRTNQLERTLERDPGARVDRESYEDDLLALAKFFERAKPTDIESEFDISSLSNLASFEILRAKRAPSDVEREAHLAEVTDLYTRLTTSSLVSARWSERIIAQAKVVDNVRASVLQSKSP